VDTTLSSKQPNVNLSISCQKIRLQDGIWIFNWCNGVLGNMENIGLSVFSGVDPDF
jgi:hypothetical protein